MPKRILEPSMNQELVHHDGVLSTQVTLCNWCDVQYESVPIDTRVDCPECLKVVAYCLKLAGKPKQPRGAR